MNKKPQRRKAPWHKPMLTVFGHLSKRTSGSTGSNTDKGHLSNTHGQG